MYSVDTNQKLVSIPCGGGHRAWDFCYHDNAGYLVYIKSGDVVFVKADLQRCQARIKVKIYIRTHDFFYSRGWLSQI